MDLLFIKASRQKLRFKSAVGSITVEDLWDLSLPALDSIAKSLNKEIKLAEEESFIKTKTKANDALETGFEVVKYVIGVKLEEAEAKKTAAEKKAQKERLIEAYARKKDAAIDNMTEAELKAAIDAL